MEEGKSKLDYQVLCVDKNYNDRSRVVKEDVLFLGGGLRLGGYLVLASRLLSLDAFPTFAAL